MAEDGTPPAIKIGDMVAGNGRAGIVVGFGNGSPLLRPFAIPEQQHTPGPPPCIVATGPVRLLKKSWEIEGSDDLAQRWATYGEGDSPMRQRERGERER